MTKVYFPREIFPFSAVLVCLVDLAVGVDRCWSAMMVYYRRRRSRRRILLLPVVVAGASWRSPLAMALFLAMSNLFYRDVKYLFEVVITVWMFATSVVYPGRDASAAGSARCWRSTR